MEEVRVVVGPAHSTLSGEQKAGTVGPAPSDFAGLQVSPVRGLAKPPCTAPAPGPAPEGTGHEGSWAFGQASSGRSCFPQRAGSHNAERKGE